MLQENKPIAYGSTSLTPAQRSYSVIEKEAKVTACEHYHYYTYYVRKIKIITEHKLLLGFINKPIDDLSPRLPCLVPRLLKYDIILKYQPGRTMCIPDALSRLAGRNRKSLTIEVNEF